ncbi:MAG: 6-carboxytetrahydropterin synthase QueD [Eubacteriales bacterium]|nr:6-carboxytetrahydropterin synthase QueD [Eubacteriales bacterium]
MYYLKAEASFDAAHFLARYQGKCRNIHGHHWIVEIRIAGDQLQTTQQEDGMLVDFSQLKHDLKQLADTMDHTLIYETGTLRTQTREALAQDGFSLTEVAFRPTAENFARHFFLRMEERGYAVAEATVYETPNNCASYTGEAQ